MAALVALPALLLGGSVSPAATDAVAGTSLVPGTVGNLYGLRLALADNGDAVAVWVDVQNSQAPVVKAAVRPAGRGWQRPRNLSHVSNAGFPDLAVDPRGNAIVVWKATVGSNDLVQQAVRRAGGSFGPARTVATTDSSVVGSLGPPKVVVDRSGRAFAVWSGGTYSAPVVQFAHGQARRGLGAAHALADGSSPAVAVDGRGTVTVAWADANAIEVAARPRARGFGSPQTLGSGTNPAVAVNARGDALVAWPSASYPESVVAASRRAGDRFAPAATVGSGGDLVYWVHPIVDKRGAGIVVWQADQYTTSPVLAAVRPPGGAFARPRTLTPDSGGFDVAAGPRGGASVVWSRYAGDLVVQSARWSSTRGGFGPARRLSAAGYNAIDPTVAINGHGRGLALWARSSGSRFVLEARNTGTTALKERAPRGPTWLAPTVLSGVGASGGRVAVDDKGRATVVWATNPISNEQSVVEAALPAPGGRLQSARVISEPGVWAAPDVGVDAAGNATVVWARGSPPNVLVEVAERSPTGGFGSPHALAPPEHYVWYPTVAVNRRGDAVVSWVASDGSTYRLEAAFRPAGGAFGAPEQISALEPYPLNPSIAVDERGDVVAVWDVYLGEASAVRAAFRPVGGPFAAPETLAEERGTQGGQYSYVSGAHAAIDAHGNATALWVDTGAMKASGRAIATGLWGSAQTIAAGTDCCTLAPNVAIDARGSAIAAWVADGQIWTSSRPPVTDVWTAPARISRAGEHAWTVAPQIGVGPTGEVVVAWRGEHVIEAAVRSPSGRFAPPRDVSQAGVETMQAPELAVDRRGDTIAVWGSVRSVLPRYSYSAYLMASRYRR